MNFANPTLSFGRPLTKLRISVNDVCNFKCNYCMPKSPVFCHDNDLLTPMEFSSIVEKLTFFGIDEVRLTGGEPTLRSDLLEIVNELGKLNLKKISITTNGSKLAQFLPDLSTGPVKSINISLDSLNRETFKKISGKDEFDHTFLAILKSRDMGFKVKINMVVMNGINDHEIIDFVRFSEREKIEVRFLEVMNIGVVRPYFTQWFLPALNILQKIKSYTEIKIFPTGLDATAKEYQTTAGGKIGIIASESMPFCGGCSRLRLSSKGVLRACLMKEYGLDIRHASHDEVAQALNLMALNKPTERIKDLARPMFQIGG